MKTRGFTLAEMLVVVTVISILMSVGLFQYNEASKKSRDYDRQSDLKTVQAALDLYKQKYGRYPARCANGQQWSGQLGTLYACTDGSGQYIVGLAPEFIPTLPQDKRLNAIGNDSGYVYAVNADGTVYKFEAKKTVESETVNSSHKLASCDVNDPVHPDGGMCGRVTSLGNNQPSWCQDGDPIFSSSYAVWGGFADAVGDVFVERGTEAIICAIQ